MAKDLAKELVKAMNEVEKVKMELRRKGILPKAQETLEKALRRLNEICAFYKIQ